jgi:hypothetical protein
MLAAWSMGCTALMSPTHYEASDTKGNQCRNECHMQCGREYLSGCLDECYSECAEFNGGAHYPIGNCFLFPPAAIEYPVPGKEEIPVPAEMQEPPAAPAEATPPAEPAPPQPTAPPADI